MPSLLLPPVRPPARRGPRPGTRGAGALCLALVLLAGGGGAAASPVGDAVMATRVLARAEAMGSWPMAAAAAEIMLRSDADAAAPMLDLARQLAAGDAAALALIEDLAAAAQRGAMAPYTRTRIEIGPQDMLEETFTFEEGRLAEIGTIPGDGAVAMVVTDAMGREICRVQGSGHAGLYCSWTPRETGEFLVTLYNIGDGSAHVWLLST